MANAHILVVDDEPDISALVAYHLARESYRVRTAASGPEAIRAAELERPDLVVLDLMLPGMSGLQVLEELRRRPETAEIPVILLTARREEQDRIAGLELGADDYVAKPFSPQELILRVGAVLRRVQQAPPAGKGGKGVRVGPFPVDTGAARAPPRPRAPRAAGAGGGRGGVGWPRPPTEYRLLLTLMERRGRVQSRRQ